MREKTIAYFYSGVSINKIHGDCILLENIDSNGFVRHALIDAGFVGKFISNFLDKHNVKKLEFLCVTHSHLDHNLGVGAILAKYQVDLLIMKEYDSAWSANGGQDSYENIIKVAIENNIKILGVSYISLGSEEYSPSRSDDFKNAIKYAKPENFASFNEKNTSFKLGSADIRIMNWEIFDSEGDLFITGQNKAQRLYSYTENQNSLGILLFQGNRKAFFAGDMNNYKKSLRGGRIGDEDRLKNEIGKIDFLKLGHHGLHHSNSSGYLDVLSPEYAVITNDVEIEYYVTVHELEERGINYLYTTQDYYEIFAAIYDEEIILGFGRPEIKKVKNGIFYYQRIKFVQII